MSINKNINHANILGTTYKIYWNMSNDPKLEGKAGYCDVTTKKIVVRDDIEIDNDTVEDVETYQLKVLRHEIVHAFLYESGLDENSEWARSEKLASWIAIQFDKITNVFDALTI